MVDKCLMIQVLQEVCFSFSPGCYSQVGSVDRVRGHRQGLVAGINRAQNPVFDRFPVAPLLLSPRHRRAMRFLHESSGPFLLLCLTSVFMQHRVPAAQMQTCLVPGEERSGICVYSCRRKQIMVLVCSLCHKGDHTTAVLFIGPSPSL